MANDRDFLGKGLRFPVSVNLNGGVSSSQFEENVRQCIFIVLGTAPGERINRPDFGCRIHDFAFLDGRPILTQGNQHQVIGLGGLCKGNHDIGKIPR